MASFKAVWMALKPTVDLKLVLNVYNTQVSSWLHSSQTSPIPTANTTTSTMEVECLPRLQLLQRLLEGVNLPSVLVSGDQTLREVPSTQHKSSQIEKEVKRVQEAVMDGKESQCLLQPQPKECNLTHTQELTASTTCMYEVR